MHVFHEQANAGQRASALMIMLPGALQDPQAFRHMGFVDALRRCSQAFDVALVDPALHFVADALDGKTMQALHEVLVEPARAQYDCIWMAGISLGGFIALSHAASFPGLLDGVCLLAPYPGTRIHDEDAAACAWPSASDDSGGEDMESRVRHWLRTRNTASPPLWLGYGSQDRFADGLHSMAKWIDKDCIEIVEGGHDWPTWYQLWDSFLCNNLSRQIEKRT